MTDPRAARLDPPDWHRRMGDLALECRTGDRHDEAELLRDMALLLRMAPLPWAAAIGALPRPERIEALLTADAAVAAALLLIEGWAGTMLSHGPGGSYLATAALPSGREASAVAESAALALLGAVGGVLAEAANEADMALGGRLN